jgi:hypothetical protein
MEPYPDILVSRQGCPNLDVGLISSYNFIRRTNEDLYLLLQKYRAKELFDKILPNTTKRDVFVFSVSLYGYFTEEHITIKVLDPGMNDDWDKTQPDISSKSILLERRLKTIAVKVLEYLLTEAICHKHEVKKFTLSAI